MHALLASGSIGMGHDVMSEACAGSLRNRGWTTDIVDSVRLMGERSGGLGERVFRGMLAVPGVYDAFHFEQLRAGGRLATLADRAAAKYLVPALDAELAARPTDLLVAVFATGAGAAARLKPKYAALRTAVFCTDVVPHRMWVHPNTDLYLVTSSAAAAFVRRYHPRADVAVVPAPARPQFYSAPTRRDARVKLDVPEDARCVLLMAGSWGIGPLREIATGLAAAGVYTLAVAGRNAPLERSLRAAAGQQPRLVPFGFSDRIPELMAAADLVITTSGDTCTEARVVGRHLLLLDTVPGHGRENLQHELELGAADVAPTDPGSLVEAVHACLDRASPSDGSAARTVEAWEHAFQDALERIGLGAA
jgi:UDP-N-acetylglucosamine:LPS N-acetylglucosamine transferase